MGFSGRGVWVMGYGRPMGYGMHFPAHQLGGLILLWDITGYGFSWVWVITGSTVYLKFLRALASAGCWRRRGNELWACKRGPGARTRDEEWQKKEGKFFMSVSCQSVRETREREKRRTKPLCVATGGVCTACARKELEVVRQCQIDK